MISTRLAGHLLVCLLLCAPAIAAAQSRCGPTVPTEEWCDAVLAEKKMKVADVELNRIYKKFIKQLPLGKRPEWIAAQRAWIKYFESNCNAASTLVLNAPATESLELNKCFESRIVERTRELKSYCQKGDCDDF